MPIETHYVDDFSPGDYIKVERHEGNADQVWIACYERGQLETGVFLDPNSARAFATEVLEICSAIQADPSEPYVCEPGDMDSYRDSVREADGTDGVVRGSQQGGAGDVTRPSGASAPPDLPTTGEAAA